MARALSGRVGRLEQGRKARKRGGVFAYAPELETAEEAAARAERERGPDANVLLLEEPISDNAEWAGYATEETSLIRERLSQFTDIEDTDDATDT